MVFSIVIILLVALIAYFHFVQGFFSATISAIISVLAALLAVSYTETVVGLLLKGKMADIANSFVLCAIFAISYSVLRVIFDAAIPGNVRTPATVDKAGAALMGLVCGVFTTGIFAIAVQMLPFGPTISYMGYSRYPTQDVRDVVVPVAGGGQQLDSHIYNQMTESSMTGDPDSRAKEKGLWFPVDDWVLDAVYHISDGGSLAGDRTLASVHPDYLQELFGERLGQQDGGRRSALVVPGNNSISLGGVFSAPSLPQVDGMSKLLRADFSPAKELKPDHDHQILIVRVIVDHNATDDEDGIFRFSTGSIHMVSHVVTATGTRDMDYYPVGLLANGNTVQAARPDDFQFLNIKTGNASIDAVFLVDNDVLVGGKTSNLVAPNTFISVKRFGLLNLGDQPIGPITPPTASQPMRTEVYKERTKIPAAAAAEAPAETTPAAPAAPAAKPAETPAPAPVEPAKPTASATASVSPRLSFSVGCKTDNINDPNVTVDGGTVALSNGNISVAQINPVDPADLAKGDSPVKDLAVPDGFKAVQVTYTTTADPFAWVQQVGAIQVVDANGNSYKANGVIVKTADKVMMRYDMNHTEFAVPSMSGAPESTVFLFVVRTGTHLTSLQVGGETTPIDANVP
jgi:hypothetical protein